MIEKLELLSNFHNNQDAYGDRTAHDVEEQNNSFIPEVGDTLFSSQDLARKNNSDNIISASSNEILKTLNNQKITLLEKEFYDILSEKEKRLKQKEYEEKNVVSRTIESYSRARKGLNTSELSYQRMNALLEGDTLEAEKLNDQITKDEQEQAGLPQEPSGFVQATGSVLASVRETLGAQVGGTIVGAGVGYLNPLAGVVAGRAVTGALVAEQTYKWETGSAFREMENNPELYGNLSNEEKAEVAKMVGMFNAAIETTGVFFGADKAVSKFILQPAIRSKLISSVIKRGITSEVLGIAVKSPTFWKSLVRGVGEIIAENSAEAFEEVFQNAIQESAINQAQAINEEGGEVSATQTLGHAVKDVTNTLTDYVSGKNLTPHQQEQLDTFKYTFGGSTFVTGGSRLVNVGARNIASRVRNSGEQAAVDNKMLDSANKSAKIVNDYMEMKRESNVPEEVWKEHTKNVVQGDDNIKSAFIPQETALDIIQKSADSTTLDEKVKLLNLQQHLNDAQEVGGKVEIPFEDVDQIIFDTKNDELYSLVKDDLSFDDADMSVNEGKELAKDLVESLKGTKGNDEVTNPNSKLYDIMQAFENKGDSAEENAINTGVAGAIFSTMASMRTDGKTINDVVEETGFKLEVENKKNRNKINKDFLGRKSLYGTRIKQENVAVENIHNIPEGQNTGVDEVVLYENQHGALSTVSGGEHIPEDGNISAIIVSAKNGQTREDAENLVAEMRKTHPSEERKAGIKSIEQQLTGLNKLSHQPDKRINLHKAIRLLGGIDVNDVNVTDARESSRRGLTNAQANSLFRKKGGRELDELGEALAEQGYFKERPSIPELLDAIENGTNIFNTEPEYNEEQRGLVEFENELAREGLLGKSAEEIYDYLNEKSTLERTVGRVADIAQTRNENEYGLDDGLNQTAWHGGAKLRGGKFSLAYAGSATGQAHGRGIYVAQERAKANNYRIKLSDKHSIKGEKLEDYLSRLISNNDYEKADIIERFAIKGDVSELEQGDYSPEIWSWFNREILPNIEGESKLYKVEVPENEFMLDEQKSYSEQPEVVKKALDKLFNEVSDDYESKQKVLERYKNKNGRSLYLLATEVAYFKEKRTLDGLMNRDNGGEEIISNYLQSQGVKGIAYESEQDGHAFVVFNPDDVKITDSLYQHPEGFAVAGKYKNHFVKLFAARNSTTFSHEMFHFLTDYAYDMYNKGLLTDEWVKHIDTLSEWAGHKKDVNGKYIVDLNNFEHRASMEKLAESFTDYLLKGKAPTSKYQKLFDSARRLFMQVYNWLRWTPRRLPKAVTDVFDSVFATSEEIEDIQNRERYGLIAKPDNMTEEQYSEYKQYRINAYNTAMTQSVKMTEKLAQKRQSEEYKAKEEEFYQDILQQMESEKTPIQERIDEALDRGIDFSSLSKIENGPQLSRRFAKENKELSIDIQLFVQDLSDIWGRPVTETEAIDMLNNGKKTEELARDYAREEVERWAVEQDPELLDIQAKESVRNVDTSKAMVAESMMLQGIPMNLFNRYWNEMIRASENVIRDVRVSNISDIEKLQDRLLTVNEQYRIAENKGDIKKQSALRYRAAVLNYQIVRGKQVRKETKKFQEHFKHYRNRPTDSHLKKISGRVYDMIAHTLYNFGYTGKKPINSQTSISYQIDEWMTEQSQNGFPYPEEMRDVSLMLDNQDKIKQSQMTVGDFEILNNALRLLEGIGKTEKEFEVEDRHVLLDESIDKIAKHYEDKGLKPISSEGARAFIRKQLMVPEVWLERFLPEDVFVDYVAPFMDGLARKANWMSDNEKKVASIIEQGQKNKNKKRIIDGREYTDENLQVILFHLGTKHNRDCLLKTLQERFGDFTEGDLDSLVNQIPHEMRQVAQNMWNYMEENAKEMKQVERRRTGAEIKLVDKDEFIFEDGEALSGGYYPVSMKSANLRTTFDQTKNTFNTPDVFPTYSITKERTGEIHGDLDLTFDSLKPYLYKMGNILKVSEAFDNMSRLGNSKRVINIMGNGFHEAINNWLQFSVNPERVNAFLNAIGKIVSVRALGYEPAKVAVQQAGAFLGFNEADAQEIVKAMGHNIADLRSWLTCISDAKKKSEYMRQRFENFSEALAGLNRESFLSPELKNKLIATGQYTAEKIDNLYKFVMLGVEGGDAMASNTVWDAVYNSKVDKFGHDKAVLFADSAVRRTQGDLSAGARPLMLQGNLRFLSPFMSYFLPLFNQFSSAMESHSAARCAGIAVFGLLVGPAYEALTQSGYDWYGMDDDKKKKWEKKGGYEAFFKESLGKNIINTAAAAAVPVLGIGNVISQIARHQIYNDRVYWNANIPVLTYLNDWGKVIDKTFSGKAGYGDYASLAGVNIGRVDKLMNIVNKLWKAM